MVTLDKDEVVFVHQVVLSAIEGLKISLEGLKATLVNLPKEVDRSTIEMYISDANEALKIADNLIAKTNPILDKLYSELTDKVNNPEELNNRIPSPKWGDGKK